MDNEIFEYYREIKRKKQESIDFLIKHGYVVGDKKEIDETIMLIKRKKICAKEGFDSIVKQLNQNKDE